MLLRAFFKLRIAKGEVDDVGKASTPALAEARAPAAEAPASVSRGVRAESPPRNISTHADPVQHGCRPTSAYVLNRYILFYISFRDLFL
jgi:hypothetical protein